MGMVATQQQLQTLHERWHDALEKVSLHDAGDRFLHAILAAYQESHRVYHTIEHLIYVLERLDELSASIGREVPPAVILAAFFHDVVYDPLKGDNEELSALWAEDSLSQMGAYAALITEVARLVRLTATHEATDFCGALLCDADLMILAEDPTRYRAYVEDLRREYGAVPEDIWRRERPAFLEGLTSHQLFHLTGWEEREKRAEANIEAEIASLTAD